MKTSNECRECDEIDECDACRERFDRRCEAEEIADHERMEREIEMSSRCYEDEASDENLLFQAQLALRSVEFTRGSRTSHYGTYERCGVRVHIRVSDHSAPCGSGYDRFSGRYHRIPDVDLVDDDERYSMARIRHIVARAIRKKRQMKHPSR